MKRAPFAVLLGLSVSAGGAGATCLFDGFGTIANPDDPACRDNQLTLVESLDGPPVAGSSIPLGYPPPLPVDSLTPVDGFRSYEALFARHQDLMLTGEGVAGTVVGQTYEGREIWAYSVGDPDRDTAEGRAEPAVIVNGTIHAREWQSPEVLTGLFERLVQIQDDGGVGQYLAENLNVVLVPVLNVDGFVQTQRFPTRATASSQQPRDGRMRRKNMRAPAGVVVDDDLDSTGDNFYGVDLNRNSVHGFGLNAGSLPNPIDLRYRGAAPASEPEAQALRAAAELAPAARLRLGIDVHSFSQVYFAPLTANARRDALTGELAGRMRAVTGFKYRYAPDRPGSGGIGTVADFFAYEYQIPAWTLETEPLNGGRDYGGTGVSHSGFVMPDSEVGRMREELADTFVLGFYRQAAPPHVVAAQISESGGGAAVYEAEWEPGGDGRVLAVRANGALVPGRGYRLWLAFNKPMRWRDASGAVTDYPGQRAGELRLALSAENAGIDIDIPVGPDAWLNSAGGPPDGFYRYRDDALAVSFRVPDTGLDRATTVALQVAGADMSGQRLDADPSTAVEWADGHWRHYENVLGVEGDEGGTDCTLEPFLAPVEQGAAPDQAAQCKAAAAAAPPPAAPADPAPAASPEGGGGGGAAPWLIISALLLPRRRRRNRA